MRAQRLGLVIGLLAMVGCGADDEVDLGTDRSATSPSCQMGPLCGDRSSSCCSTLDVPGGTFFLGDDTTRPDSPDEVGEYLKDYGADERDSGQLLEATVEDFRLDRYEVTVGRFRKFVDAYAEGWRPGIGDGSSTDGTVTGWTAEDTALLPESETSLVASLDCDEVTATFRSSAGSGDDLPINCVSYALAAAFCIWDEARLPSEQEWEYAAAGGDEERLAPWGDEFPPTPTHASYQCMGDGDVSCMRSDILNVGSLPDGNGRWGHSDLAGSMWEWTASVYRELHRSSADKNASAVARTIRGGSWVDQPVHTRAAERDFAEPAHRSYSIGLRCARN